MEETVERRKAQLASWSRKIHDLAARTQRAGARARFDDLVYVDELKALLAIAQAKFDAFRAARGEERAGAETEMMDAWNELTAAFTSPEVSRHSRKKPGARRIPDSAGPAVPRKREP